MASPPRRRRAWLLVGYITFLHAALIFVCLKTNFRTLSAKTLGLQPPEERSVGLYQSLLPWAKAARDLAPGGVAVIGDSMVKDLDPAGIAENAAVLGAGGITVAVLRESLVLAGSLSNAESLVVCAGVNDLKYRSPDEILPEYMALLGGLPEGPRVLCLSLLPVDESIPALDGRSFISNDEIAALNGLLEAALAESPRYQFADVRGVVRTPDGDVVPGAYHPDGWHLSPAGRGALEVAIRDRLVASRR